MAIRLDNWVSTLKRAAAWNHWSTEDQFLQLVVHLRGRALQEWDLILDGEKSQFQPAIEALKERLERGTIQLVEQLDDFQDKTTVQVEPTLVKPDVDGLAKTILSNPTGRSCDVERGTVVGAAHPVAIVEPSKEAFQSLGTDGMPDVRAVLSHSERCDYLRNALGKSDLLVQEQTQCLHQLLENFMMPSALMKMRGERQTLSRWRSVPEMPLLREYLRGECLW